MRFIATDEQFQYSSVTVMAPAACGSPAEAFERGQYCAAQHGLSCQTGV
jgi:hypothetical protein